MDKFMKKFWTYIKNDKYAVGCTGGTVYVYDKDGNERTKFKDMRYAYDAAFSPDGRFLAVKSTENMLGFYSMESMTLIRKVNLKYNMTQDDGFAFSPDSGDFYNIECLNNVCSAIVVYKTPDFTESARLLEGEPMYLRCIEFENNRCYVTGYKKHESIYEENEYFIAELVGDKLENHHFVDEKIWEYVNSCKLIENMGFTKKSIRWVAVMKENEVRTVKLSELYKDNGL